MTPDQAKAVAETVGTHPRFVAMIRELCLERLSGSPRRALGARGPAPDTCDHDCCPAPRQAPAAGTRVGVVPSRSVPAAKRAVTAGRAVQPDARSGSASAGAIRRSTSSDPWPPSSPAPAAIQARRIA